MTNVHVWRAIRQKGGSIVMPEQYGHQLRHSLTTLLGQFGYWNSDQYINSNMWQIHLFSPIYTLNLMRISTEVTLSLLSPDNHQLTNVSKI